VLGRAVARVRAWPRWAQLALAAIVVVGVWSAVEMLPDGRRPFSSGTMGPTPLARGWSTADGRLHLEFEGSRGFGRIIDGMDAAGTTGTITMFHGRGLTVAGAFGETCRGSWTEDASGVVNGMVACDALVPSNGGGPMQPMSSTFTLRR
jgi:hypothetical protein